MAGGPSGGRTYLSELGKKLRMAAAKPASRPAWGGRPACAATHLRSGPPAGASAWLRRSARGAKARASAATARRRPARHANFRLGRDAGRMPAPPGFLASRPRRRRDSIISQALTLVLEGLPIARRGGRGDGASSRLLRRTEISATLRTAITPAGATARGSARCRGPRFRGGRRAGATCRRRSVRARFAPSPALSIRAPSARPSGRRSF